MALESNLATEKHGKKSGELVLQNIVSLMLAFKSLISPNDFEKLLIIAT